MAQLCQHLPELERLETDVVLVSFDSGRWARSWLEETCAPFRLLLDAERRAYRAYALDHSLLRSWGPKTLLRYARLLLAGRKWRGIRGDSGQLGGDFVIDGEGILRFAQRSRDPTDRPSPDRLLEVLREMNQPG